jgi:hypothetical protein
MSGSRLGLAFVTALLLGAPSAAAQTAAPSPDRWQLTFTDQSYLWDVRLVRLDGDTLVVRSRDSLIDTPVAQLTELRLLPETILKVGDGHRSGIGALSDNNVRVVDLAPMDANTRRATLQAILARQTVAP